jgi:2-oxoglutarate ferredoxin oxidoreductase subunit alpha
VAGIQPAGHDLIWTGETRGDLLLIGWGSTFGAIKAAALQMQGEGLSVSAVHIRYLNPMPARLGEIMKSFRHVLAPELNMGQLRLLLRARFLVDVKGLNKVRGQPFTISEIVRGARAVLDGAAGNGELQLAGNSEKEVKETAGG